MKFLNKYTFFSFLVLLSIMCLIPFSVVLADNTAPIQPYGTRDMNAPISLDNAYLLPGVHATDLLLHNDNGKITGSFTAWNNEATIISGLQYTIEILGANGNLYQIYPVRDQFTLVANEKRTIHFSYHLSQLPKGDYVFRIQLATNGGRLLGWSDQQVVSITHGVSPFVTIAPSFINLGQFPGQHFDPQSGPNVSPSGHISLKAAFKNTGLAPLTVVPVLQVYDFNIAKQNGSHAELAPVTLLPGAVKDFTFPVVATTKAGVYSALLTLTDTQGKTLSNIGEYRWVVTGASADVLPLQINHLAVTKGDQTMVKLDFVGAPDAQTISTANVDIEMKDAKGVVAKASLSGIQLSDAIVQSTAALALQRDVVGVPTITVSIKDATRGVLLASNTITLSLSKEQLQSFASKQQSTFPYIPVAIVGALLLVIGFGVRIIGKNNKSLLHKILLPGLGLLMFCIVLLGTVHSASAFNGNGIEVWTASNAGPIWHNLDPSGPVVSLFINAPIHDAPAGTYPKNAVPLSYRLTYGVCDNKVSSARVIGRFDLNGAKQTSLDGVNANWSTIHDAAYSYGPACPNGAGSCFATSDFSSTLNLSALGNKCSTTLQLAAKLGQVGNCNPPVPNGTISSTDPNFTWTVGISPSNSGCVPSGPFYGQTFHFAQAINLWLNFPCGVCQTNSDCGTNGLTGNPFCQNGNVYQNFKTHTCNNPGTANATCTSSITAQLQTTCGANQTCSNGTCNNVSIACNANVDCGTNGFVGSPFCQGNSVYQNFRAFTCNNPGTANATCTNSNTTQLQTTCNGNQTCSSGSCINMNITCNSNSDCGTNALTGSPFCQNGNVYQNFKAYTCNNPGTAQASCSNATTAQLQTTCGGSQTCSNGTCNNVNITCSSNSQCGTSAFVGSPFCQNNAIYQNFKTFTCNNPGTANSTCSNSTAPQQQSTCTGNQTCSNGSCTNVNIACSNNADCGTNGLIGNPFCQGSAIYQNFKTFTCNNPGTANAVCGNSTSSQLQTNCTDNQVCSNGSCANNNLVVSCVGSPNNAQTNQSVTFNATASGGNGNYTYAWAGSCNGFSQTCSNTFGQPNTYTAFLNVTSGTQTQSTSCSVNVSQACTSRASQRCVGNSVYWFDSCGVQQDLAQQCGSNQTCQNNSCVNQQQEGIVVVKTVRNLSTGNLTWSPSISANLGDIVQFNIAVSSSNSQYINNVTVRDILSAGLTYQNNLTLDGIPNSGNIISGLSIGSLVPGQTRTITYQAQVSSAQTLY